MKDAEKIAEEMSSWLSSGVSRDPGSVMRRLLEVPAIQFAGCLDAMDDILASRWVEDAWGASLDAVGARFTIDRMAGESDAAYRARIEHTIAMRLSYGTVADVQRFVGDMLGLDPDAVEVIESYVQQPNAVFMIRICGQPTGASHWDAINQTVRDVKAAGVCYRAVDLILALLPVEIQIDVGRVMQRYVRMPACSGWGYMQWGDCPWGSGDATMTIECGEFEVV
ncbi:hypothetical protein O0S10_01780 [Methanocorpusculum sp. MG]|uniref:Uncharacterized protein n=1 Tax=Methanocorpusculum petauri TaxID=3002863 RepID=A0ABT4IDZ9_9EURY|nr:hypothetical protein [Methanocorpusculum petauri]MCZ0859957.1 hypothetical protein [Methanocorpusculum petauri]